MTQQEFNAIPKMWMLAKQAFKDLKRVEKLKSYVIDMSEWHDYNSYEKKCYVCMAGACLTNFIPKNKNVNYILYNNDLGTDNERTSELMDVINRLRCGEIKMAYRLFYRHEGIQLENSIFKDLPYTLPVESYCYSPEKFKEDFVLLIAYLKELNV